MHTKDVPAAEVEVTPEMTEAGVEAWATFRPGDRPDWLVGAVYEAMERAFHDEDLVIRITGDTLAIAPPLIVSEAQVAEIFEKTARVIRAVM